MKRIDFMVYNLLLYELGILSKNLRKWKHGLALSCNEGVMETYPALE